MTTRWSCPLCGNTITTHLPTSPPVCQGRHRKAIEMRPTNREEQSDE